MGKLGLRELELEQPPSAQISAGAPLCQAEEADSRSWSLGAKAIHQRLEPALELIKRYRGDPVTADRERVHLRNRRFVEWLERAS